MIYTSCYSNIRKLVYEFGFKYPDFVGISIYEPKIGVEGYNIEFEKKLAPKKNDMWLFKNGYISWKEYSLKYYDKLYNLEKKYLDTFIDKYDGKVFLCYEQSDKFCHRKLLRKFLSWYYLTTFGFDIPIKEFNEFDTLTVEDLFENNVNTKI